MDEIFVCDFDPTAAEFDAKCNSENRIAFDHKAEKASTLIGLQEKPHDDVIGGSGEPLADLLALINNEMGKDRTVFVLEDTLFCSGNRLLRVNEELVFRPQHHTKIDARDMEGLESDWKVHPS